MISDADVEIAVAAAAQLALFYVGTPENEMLLALHDIRSDVQARLTEPFGPDIAAAIASSFVDTVARRRRELEAGSGTSRVVN
jgi:hypothetical protein